MAAKAAIGLALAGVGAIGQAVMSAKAAKQQEKAAALQQQGEDVKRIMQQRRIRAQARAQIAETEQGGAIQGATATTAVQGGIAGAQTQSAAGQTFLDQMGSISHRVFGASAKAASYGAKAGAFGGLGSLGGALFDAGGGFDALKGSPTHAPSGSIGFGLGAPKGTSPWGN